MTSHHLQKRVPHFTPRHGDTHAGGLDRRNFRLGSAFAAADDGARVTHAASGWCSRTRDESGDRLLAILFDPLGGFFFRAAANFANHNDSVRVRIVVEQFYYVQMRRAVHGIATAADASGLADAARSQLPDRFVSQRAAARDNSDVAFLVNVTGRDADAATDR